ncbi:MAG: shikimate dehydrogenase [Desulfovibrionaceae bacterium]|nr:shikimate dehydrogenase [Desulfovibrionaceae bacterium]
MDSLLRNIEGKIYAVIGYPLDQTLSPLIHNLGFKSLNLAATYIKLPIEPKNLADFVQKMRLRPISGCSVTIPHKQNIISYIDKLTPSAQKISAVNTLFWQNGQLCGDNTDMAGFLDPLKDLDLKELSVLVLGAGGAARACVCGLDSCQVREIYLTTQSNKNHLALAKEFGCTPIPWEDRYHAPVDMVVNATPLGMHGQFVDQNPYDFSKLTESLRPQIAYDIVYNPLETLFLRKAAQTSAKTISGFQMFLAQANAQFHLWTGENLPPDTKDVLRAALNASS